MKLDLKYFRVLGFAEGSSLLILFFIAMPYRAFTQDHMPVRVTGMIHGILFLLYIAALLNVALEYRWSIKRGILALVTASLPFGTFWFDHKYLSAKQPEQKP